ncbi:ADP-dependent NAD(P)H-hydrate dehydratase [Microcella sp.]|uniref:ADP-dependent NAD(P)H-hydrate dehydratase n=1 Tax=Microcella sp. TaxID=1913979 RepID=UPI003F6E7856
MSEARTVTTAEVAALLRVPGPHDDKYSRGVLGMITGSTRYPGAAVLGVEAALRTGVGMVRYLGPARAADLVLQRRPEAVTAEGRVQAWVLGSGMDAGATAVGEGPDAEAAERMRAALASGRPLVIDAGALDAVSSARGPAIITPHARELARVIGGDLAAVLADPERAARAAAEQLGVTVLLKGHATHVVAPGGPLLVARSATPWLATAGAGDALAGILGALVATHAASGPVDPALLARLGAAAAVVHGLAAQRASAGGPVTVLDVCAAVPATIAALLRGRGD